MNTKETSNITAFDTSIFGGIDGQGNIKSLAGQDALGNSIKMFLALEAGDLIRNPGLGGVLFRFLKKPMHTTTADEMRMPITDGLKDFEPLLVLRDVQIEPDYARKLWNIAIVAYSPELNLQATVNETIRGEL